MNEIYSPPFRGIGFLPCSRLLPAVPAPTVAAWTLTALVALAVSAGVYWIPIQVSDSLEIMEAVEEFPSASAAFVAGLHSSATMLRPLRQLQTKVLLNVAHAAGDRYNTVFRGYHAVGAAALIVLFGALARPRTWTDVRDSACACFRRPTRKRSSATTRGCSTPTRY